MDYFSKIVGYIKKRKEDNYSGAARFTLSKGEVVMFNTMNAASRDILLTPLDEESAIKIIREHLSPSCSSSTILVFDNGQIVAGSWINTWQGKELVCHALES